MESFATGMNVSMFALGSARTDRGPVLRGSPRGPGLAELLTQRAFAIMERKRKDTAMKHFAFRVAIKYVRLFDDKIYNLIQKPALHQ